MTALPLVVRSLALASVATILVACAGVNQRSFGEDVAFLQKHVETHVLGQADGPAIAVVPAYQGRVMTSTATGHGGSSHGWINYELIQSGETVPHIHVFGGEDRFWLGPEGGQYAIFFAPGTEFTLDDWQTPAVIDTETYDLVEQAADRLVFRKQASLTNYSGARFELQIDREIRLLGIADTERLLGIAVGDAKVVAYQSDNRISNTGEAWTREQGLLSVWILGMYKPSPATTVVIPFRKGGEAQRGPIVNDEYFGKVPAERLVVEDGVLYFSGDGQFRSKIGLSPRRSTPVCGSWDATRGVLTVVQYNQPASNVVDYVNSMWQLQDKPYGGDVINSYNDGPPEPGKKPLGPFYELETSSPAAALQNGESLTHVHRTFHFEGARDDLDRIAKVVFGQGLEAIEAALR